MKSLRVGNFQFQDTSIKGVKVIEPVVYKDSRGHFAETYKYDDFCKGGIDAVFVQDNQSSSIKGVLRGMHYQIERPQAKLVRVIEGAVFDVVVDLREGSDTFGSWVGEVLSSENMKQLFIPKGFAHGFLVLSEHATFCYKCDDVYCPGDEGGIAWNDPSVGIIWPALEGDASFNCDQIILSEKDKAHPLLNEVYQELHF